MSWLLLLSGCRPDQAFGAYSGADELRELDGDGVRVHYSERGPNAADATDRDDDGVRDVAEDALDEAEAALVLYADLGFRAPVSEAEVGLAAPGGSDALDVYLEDRANLRYPGVTVTDRCDTAGRCAVHILAPSDDPQQPGLVAHEVFHAVQAAYDGTEARWLHEGTATRMEIVSEDGMYDTTERAEDWRLSNDYLARTDCGLAQIDGDGPCADAAYGTEVLWFFLEDQVDPAIVRGTWEAAVDEDGVDALEHALDASGTRLSEEWATFAAWNLATGDRSASFGYYWAIASDGVVADAEGESIGVHRRMAPLSARYYRIDHPGGDLLITVVGDGVPLRVTVHPVHGGEADGPLDGFKGPWGLPSDGTLRVPDLPAGGVWVAVSHVDPDEPAVTVDLCIGSEASPCEPTGCSTARAPLRSVLLGALVLAGMRRRHPARLSPPKGQ